MKFTLSSSLSSSSSSTCNSLSENFCTSKGNTFGCLSGFLSRILCSKTLPTYPIHTEKQQHFFKVVDHDPTSSNIVAKLMGLDSMPQFKVVTPLEESGEMEERLKISFSFKETPEFFELEDDDFFSPIKPQMRNKKRKKQRGRREKCRRKQSRNRDEEGSKVFSIEDRLSLKISAQNIDKNVGNRNQSYHLSPLKERPISRRQEADEIKARKMKMKESCSEEIRECESENLSPVSVLDHSEFISDAEAATSEEDVKIGGSHEGRDIVRRDLRCDESSMWEEREREGKYGEVGLMIKKKECRKDERLKMLNRVYRLAEEEMANNCNSNYNYRDRGMLRVEELEDASTHFGQLIFDHLISELVHQLLGLPCLHF